VEIKQLTAVRLLDLDWLRTRTEQQLIEHKAVIDQLMADLPTVRGTNIPNPVAINYIAEYLCRTNGIDQALAYLNYLEHTVPSELIFSTKFEFLLQHERSTDLQEYINELTQRKISSPLLLLRCINYYMSLGKRQHSEYYLSRLITDYPRSRELIEAVLLATVYKLNFDRAVFEEKILWGSKFLALEKHMLGLEEIDVLPIVHCINLDRSSKRMLRCTDLYQNSAELRRIPGMPGQALPDYLLRKMTINPALPKSAIGCSLSHIAAWERVADDESDLPQIVVEDDGLPVMVNQAIYSITHKLMKQQKLDILYIHEGASPLEFCIQEFSSEWEPKALPFQINLGRFIRHQKKLRPGWGMYGYMLSASGAQKLLGLYERDGLANHVDWQTFLYSVTDWNHPVASSKNNVAINYQRTTGHAPQRELDSGVLNFPIIAHLDFSSSTR
jgi:GR25 family glycosyltransferase involved in LPS biosynthesis